MNPNAVISNEPGHTEYLALDIETTGKHPLEQDPEAQVISCVLGDFAEIQTGNINEVGLLINLSEYAQSLNKSTTTIITFMGGTMYSPSFDWAYLRVRFLKNGLVWPFKGFNHIDVFPIIQKWFDLDFSELGVLEDLNASDLKKFAIYFGLTAETTIKNNLFSIRDMVSEDQINEHLKELGSMKNKTHNTLKDAAYHLLGIEDDGMRGKDVPPLFKKWQETGDEEIIKTILKYNKADCEKTMRLFEAVSGMVPNRILSGELL